MIFHEFKSQMKTLIVLFSILTPLFDAFSSNPPTWFVLNPQTGAVVAGKSHRPPQVSENEIIISKQDRDIYNRYVKDVFLPKFQSVDDQTASKLLAKRYGIGVEKLYQISKKVEMLNYAIKKGKVTTSQ